MRDVAERAEIWWGCRGRGGVLSLASELEDLTEDSRRHHRHRIDQHVRVVELPLDGEGDADDTFSLPPDEDAAKNWNRAERRVETIKGHISAPEIDCLRFEVDAAAHGGAELRPIYISVVQQELPLANRERRAQLVEGDAALPHLLLALAAERGLRLRIGEHVAHHGIAEHGEVARPERAGLVAGVARVKIDLERGPAAIDPGI